MSVSVATGASHAPAQYQQAGYQLAQPQPQQGSETVVLPADAVSGKEYSFTAQNGQNITFAVPAGMGPGMSVSVATGASHAQAQFQPQLQQQQQQQQQYLAALQQQQLQQQYQQQQFQQQQLQYQQHAQSSGAEAVTLPADAVPGKQYTFQAQDGRSVTFTVPPGMGPGSVLNVQI